MPLSHLACLEIPKYQKSFDNRPFGSLWPLTSISVDRVLRSYMLASSVALPDVRSDAAGYNINPKV
jgi:hypothetical protein